MSRTHSNLPSNAITSEDILGKDVLDADGLHIGVVDKLYIDPASIQVLGFSVDKGFLRDGLMIGTKHVAEITAHAIFLTIRPAFRLRGVPVFGVDGGLVGHVQSVSLHEEDNTINELVVRVSRRKTIVITQDVIDRVDESVLLSVNADELEE
ncbi:MAG: PRC-barrel domain-containing protein [Candidatus Woesearchaeota archaeon]